MYLLFLFFQIYFVAQAEECKAVSENAPFEAYLVTSGPGRDMYTRVGHSAIWASGGGKPEVFFNWGVYNSKQDNFLWRFFMGTAEFKLSLMSEKKNTKRIKDQDQMLKAQRLNLSPAMKIKLQELLTENSKKENRNYVYHWEEQNCATMIRNMLDKATNGGLQQLKEEYSQYTRRHEVLRHLAGLHWTWFGWHFMASSYGETPYNKWEILHIPERFMEEAQSLELTWEDGSTHKFIDKECILNEGSYGWSPPTPPTRWPILWMIGIGLGLFFSRSSRSSMKAIRILGSLSMALFFLISGGLGSIFMLFWMTSSLEGYGPNENWFYANPLTLLMVPYALLLLQRNARWNEIASLIPMILASIVCLGIMINPFGEQVNIDFIGLFGLPILFIALHLFKK